MTDNLGEKALIKNRGTALWKVSPKWASVVALIGLGLQIVASVPLESAGLNKGAIGAYVVLCLLLGMYALFLNVDKEPTAQRRGFVPGAIIFGGTIFVSVIALALQIADLVSREVPGWSKGAIGTNIVVGLMIAAYGWYLSTDKGVENENPKIIKAIVIALGIYTLTQAVFAAIKFFWGA